MLDEQGRLSYYPASALCSINLWFTGLGSIVVPAGHESVERLTISGPYTVPTATRTDGPAHGMMILLRPDAVATLTGLSIEALANKTLPISGLLPRDWVQFFTSLQADMTDEKRVHLVHAFFLARCHTQRAALAANSVDMRDWIEALAIRAATSKQGRSLRQIERRIKSWAGLAQRDLHLLAQAERAYLHVKEHTGRDDFSWAGIAQETGYADQSHLCRVSKRITGFSPQELRRRMHAEEAFWVYRLWE